MPPDVRPIRDIYMASWHEIRQLTLPSVYISVFVRGASIHLTLPGTAHMYVFRQLIYNTILSRFFCNYPACDLFFSTSMIHIMFVN